MNIFLLRVCRKTEKDKIEIKIIYDKAWLNNNNDDDDKTKYDLNKIGDRANA